VIIVEGAKAKPAFAVFFKFDALCTDKGGKVNRGFDALDGLFFYHISFSLLPRRSHQAKPGYL